MADILKLVNNTTEISLISDNYMVTNWEPALPAWKETSVSPFLSDGSRLISRNFEDVIETLTLTISSTSPTNVATLYNNLKNLLELGVKYEMGQYQYPTYVVVTPENISNSTYGRIKKYKIDKLPQIIHTTPFKVGSIVNGSAYSSALASITLVLQVEIYKGQAPGSSTSTGMRSLIPFNGTNYGTVDSAGATQEATQVAVSPKFVTGNITHIYRFDSSGASFSSNILGASVPFNMFPSPLGNNDYVVFIASTGVTGNAPFHNIVLDLTQVSTTTMTGKWQYWTGAAWADLTGVVDGSTGFSVSGRSVVTWVIPSDMSTKSENSITGWVVRYLITNTNGNTQIPQQGNRIIYSTNQQRVTIVSTSVAGQIEAHARLRLHNLSSVTLSRVIMGLRSVSKGSNFGSSWNMASTNNPTGITWQDGGLNGGLTLTRAYFPTGTAPYIDTTGPSTGYLIGYFTISGSIVWEYKGKFKFFLGIRAFGITGTQTLGDMLFYFQVRSSDGTVILYESNRVPLSALPSLLGTEAVQMIELGEHQIIPDVPDSVTFEGLRFYIYTDLTQSANYDANPAFIMMIPSDEYSFDIPVSQSKGGAALSSGNYIEVDGLGRNISAIIRKSSNDAYVGAAPPRLSQKPVLQANADQRLYFLTMGASNAWSPSYMLDVEVDHVSRYLSALRGG